MISGVPSAERIDVLIREAESIFTYDYLRLESLAAEIITLSERANLPDKLAEGVAYLAWSMLQLSRSEEALRLIFDALALSREYHARRGEYLALRVLWIVFFRADLLDEALRLNEIQNRLEAELDFPFQRPLLQQQLGMVEYRRNIPLAADYMRQAVQMLPRLPESRGASLPVLRNAAIVLTAHGQLDEAMAFADEGLETARALNSAIWIARMRVVAAVILRTRGEFDGAYRIFDDIRDVVETLRFPLLTCEYYVRYGGTLAEDLRYSEAARVLEIGCLAAVEHGHIALQIEALKHLAACYEKLGDIPAVSDTYKRMTVGIVRQQQQTADLRFGVLKAAFEVDRANAAAQIRAARLQASALRKISDDFRAPLESIRSNTDSITDYAPYLPKETVQARLSEIMTQVQWMTQAMDDIAELLQPSAEDFPTYPFTGEQLVQHALKDIENYRLDAERIIVQMESGGLLVAGAFDALRRTLAQILSNALKFSSHAVTLDITVTRSSITLMVQDSGTGIPASEQALVLHPMYRGTNAHGTEGKGIGLSLVDKLVRGAGATLDIASDDTGTCVTIHWPVKPAGSYTLPAD